MVTEDPGPQFDPLAILVQFASVDPAFDASRQAYARLLEGKNEEELRWWSKDTVAVVTGGNKGVGFQIVSSLATKGITTILTARDEGRGIAAVEKLKAQGLGNVLFHQLDVTSPDSAAKLASWIKEKIGGVDILVCNAGIGAVDISYETAKRIVGTNYFGQRITVSALLPLLRPSPAGGRILFIGSECGRVEVLKSETVKQLVSDIDNLTEEDVDALASQYLEEVKAGHPFEWTDTLFPQYNESKMLLHAYSRVLAKSFAGQPEGEKVYVNCATPGFVSTDLVANYPAARKVQDGVEPVMWLLLFPSGGPTGGFFKDRADFPF